MNFETWWKKEGSVMQESECASEVIARAAWFVAKQPPVCTCWRCMGLEKDPYEDEESEDD